MPFGLTNAPRIFQRAMDDILREQVGKTCHVYMDDIIIFSKTYKRVSPVNGYSIIKHYHMVTIFDTRYTFYEIDGLKSDFLIGYNLLKK